MLVEERVRVRRCSWRNPSPCPSPRYAGRGDVIGRLLARKGDAPVVFVPSKNDLQNERGRAMISNS
jgi:hypothetical protein